MIVRNESVSTSFGKRASDLEGLLMMDPTCEGAKDSEWSEEHVTVLSHWKSQAFVHMYLQDKSSYYFRMIYNSMTFPIILLSAVSSVTLFSSENESVKIYVAVVSIISACLTALLRQVRPAETAAQHAEAAHRYQALIHRMESCMNIVPSMRPNLRMFFARVRTELESLLSHQTDPPRFVLSNFEKHYGRVEGILYGDEIANMIAQSLRAQDIYKRMEKINRNVSEVVTIPMESDLSAVRRPPSPSTTYKHPKHADVAHSQSTHQQSSPFGFAQKVLPGTTPIVLKNIRPFGSKTAGIVAPSSVFSAAAPNNNNNNNKRELFAGRRFSPTGPNGFFQGLRQSIDFQQVPAGTSQNPRYADSILQSNHEVKEVRAPANITTMRDAPPPVEDPASSRELPQVSKAARWLRWFTKAQSPDHVYCDRFLKRRVDGSKEVTATSTKVTATESAATESTATESADGPIESSESLKSAVSAITQTAPESQDQAR